MKLISKIIVLSVTSIMFFSSSIYASEEENSDTIPERMKPNTIITFVEDNSYAINKGGTAEFNQDFNNERFNSFIERAKENGSYKNAYIGKLPKPVKGLKVYYADDGYLLKLEYPKGVNDPLMKEKNSINTTMNDLNYFDIAKDSNNSLREGPGPDDVLLYTWGAHNNQIWRMKSGGRLGGGRATTFDDEIGQADNYLGKGDCATSMQYDNCKYGTKLNVLIKRKDTGIQQYHTLTKADVGGMPDAVLDIWKTGVELWGYKWTSTLSINDVMYIHD